VGTVNERLRGARRKTGVGSSRELARMFAAQENRDELIGVATVGGADPDSIPSAAASRPWNGFRRIPHPLPDETRRLQTVESQDV
jgi:hypothetical protein